LYKSKKRLQLDNANAVSTG